MVKYCFIVILAIFISSGCKEKNAITPIEKNNVAKQTAKRTIPELTPAPKKPEPKLSDSEIAENRSSFTYHIVAASYNKNSQAERFKARLYQKGYPSIVLEKDGKFRVILQSFSKKETAIKELERLRKLNKKRDLWLLHQ